MRYYEIYWPNIHIVDEHYVKTCTQCLRIKAKPQKEDFHHMMVMYPLELVHMSYLTIENPRSDKDINILIITDYFAQYAQAIITSLQTAKVTALTYGAISLFITSWPTVLLSDQVKTLKKSLLNNCAS